MTGIASRTLFAYGALRMPLALLELPLYVLLPSFYGEHLGVPLVTIGAILFAMRLLDAIADPLIGRAIDQHRDRQTYRRWIWIALPVLAIGFGAMFSPPDAPGLLPLWLAASSGLTYLAYSVVSIAYQAWGAGLSDRADEQARVTGVREGFGLIGVLAAAALLAPERARWLIGLFVVLALIAGYALRWAPSLSPTRAGSASGDWAAVFQNRAFRWLLATFVINGVATAIPATLVLFYVADVLGSAEHAPFLLLIYFLSAALGMPLWITLARRMGLRNAWLLGMCTAVAGFSWTLGLGHGDLTEFGWVCAATGFALGADLAMPPAMLAMTIGAGGHRGRLEGRYFGVWHLASKLNLALAAGIALPLLASAGYQPGSTDGALALSLGYAALPSLLKLIAGALLLVAPQTQAEIFESIRDGS